MIDPSRALRWFPHVAVAIAVAAWEPPARARAQDVDPRQVAARVHEEGGYPNDIPLLGSDSRGFDGADLDGAGDGPEGDTSLDPSREAGERGTDTEVPAYVRWLIDWLGWLLGGLQGPQAQILLIVAAAFALALLAFLVVRFVRLPDSAKIPGASTTEPRDADPFLVRGELSAEAWAAQGRYREAIHAVFLDTLARIGGAEGRFEARTARELVHAISAGRRGRDQLDDLLTLTELVWWGARPATADQYRAACALSGEVPNDQGLDEASR